MLDPYNREIDYLRISITDRCNLRCRYCMPPHGIPLKEHNDCLSFEQIVKVVEQGVSLGIKKVRLTGGEPLVRRGVVSLVQMLSRINGLQTIGMTSNGQLLSQYARSLKKGGLSSLNISLDTLDAERYSYLTRGGDIQKVFNGIEEALKVGFPIKINMVVAKETSQEELNHMVSFCEKKGLSLQRIKEYSLEEQKDDYIVFERPPKCSNCNRIRLLSGGQLKPCLHSNDEITLDWHNLKGSLEETIMAKPKSGEICLNRSMVEIGG